MSVGSSIFSCVYSAVRDKRTELYQISIPEYVVWTPSLLCLDISVVLCNHTMSACIKATYPHFALFT